MKIFRKKRLLFLIILIIAFIYIPKGVKTYVSHINKKHNIKYNLPKLRTGGDNITPKSYCGDDICNNNETCDSCKADCGFCDVDNDNPNTDVDCNGADSKCDSQSTPTEFGIFPMTKTNKALSYSADRIIDLNLKLVTKFEMWNVRQASQNGDYTWGGMDRVMEDFLDKTDTKMFLRVTPWGLNSDGSVSWYCDKSQSDKVPDEFSCVIAPQYESDFKDYIDAITKRYAGLDKIAFSNEWTGSHFVGDQYDYVKYANWLYDITKRNSPNTEVVLGAITSNPMRYMTGCLLEPDDPNHIDKIYFKGRYLNDTQEQEFCDSIAGAYDKFIYALEHAKYDAVDIHLYDDYDYWDEYTNALATLTDKPIYVSEFGGPSPYDPKRSDESYQAQELKKYMDKIIDMNIPQAYYFQLIETGAYHADSALIKTDEDYNPIEKANYNVFKNRYNNHH